MNQKNKLNLGCGKDYRKGWINLDYDKEILTDVYFDLTSIYKGEKLPFRDGEFDLIIMHDVLEHFPEPLPILRELYRVCKVKGIIEIKVPLGNWVWDNLDHKRKFNYNSFDLISFRYGHCDKKELRIILKKRYVLPSRNFLYHIARWVFGKRNLHLQYRKLR